MCVRHKEEKKEFLIKGLLFKKKKKHAGENLKETTRGFWTKKPEMLIGSHDALFFTSFSEKNKPSRCRVSKRQRIIIIFFFLFQK
jgi:hypothetical protein